VSARIIRAARLTGGPFLFPRLRFREQGSRLERESYFAVYRLTTRTVGAARVQLVAP